MKIVIVYFTIMWRDYIYKTLAEELPSDTKINGDSFEWKFFGKDWSITFVRGGNVINAWAYDRAYIQGDSEAEPEKIDKMVSACKDALIAENEIYVIKEYDDIMKI